MKQGVAEQSSLAVTARTIIFTRNSFYDAIFRDLEQPGGEPAPQPEAAQHGQVPEGPLGEVFE
ncbi:hypothetical protein MTR_3g048150 [Medicago truncatula]|uniref:Uncharacterized protein n=1 Tax=Medicago truncatula TaxID=3880 RepID=G7IXY6_MEDTR|nr:hypothetical protein MTR_3g048150 [Medicago truncatula]